MRYSAPAMSICPPCNVMHANPNPHIRGRYGWGCYHRGMNSGHLEKLPVTSPRPVRCFAGLLGEGHSQQQCRGGSLSRCRNEATKQAAETHCENRNPSAVWHFSQACFFHFRSSAPGSRSVAALGISPGVLMGRKQCDGARRLTGVALADATVGAIKADILWDVAPLDGLGHDVETLVATLDGEQHRENPNPARAVRCLATAGGALGTHIFGLWWIVWVTIGQV